MASVIKNDRIVTARSAVELSCPTCDFVMVVHLKSDLRQQNDMQSSLDHTDNPLAANHAAQDDAQNQRRIAALKAKILRSLINLPPMPHIILKARDILSDPESSLKDLARVIETDQGMVAKVLTLANSAYYGVSGMISSIQHASVLLGQKTLGQMITISASSALLNKKLRGYGIAPDEMWRHSLACAFAAKRIAEMSDENLVEDAFTAGLLHDAGKIILDPYVVKHKAELAREDCQTEPALFEIEKAIIGFDHAEIMSRACRLWRFPEVQVTAIRFHHQPSCSEEHQLACMIHLANIAAKSAGFATGAPAKAEPVMPDILDFLDIPAGEWDELAGAVSSDVQNIEEELQE